ncbi:MAG: aspartate aminotransferase family protein, partial [Acetanaerobacterium sp.]
NIKYFEPYPIIMRQGHGSRLTDVDGNTYIDYLLCYGALLLGHGHPAVTEAVTKTMEETGTTVFGTPHVMETTMAEVLREIYPSIEMLRYTNSGLEATLFAIRLAFAFTGRSKLAKFEGHYHGGHDRVLVSVNPTADSAGSADSPTATSESLGLPDYYVQNTVVLPFNDIEATDRLLRCHVEEIACVIIEPVQGGFIPAKPEFMRFLRKITTELGIVLVYDEVKTGFRVSLGGAQEVYDVKPDITALGKVVGGGFAIGVVGGRKDILSLCSPADYTDILAPDAGVARGRQGVFHSGTYNGHPIVLAAGLATIGVLRQGDVMQRLFASTEYLRTQLEALYAQSDIA